MHSFVHLSLPRFLVVVVVVSTLVPKHVKILSFPAPILNCIESLIEFASCVLQTVSSYFTAIFVRAEERTVACTVLRCNS